MANYKINSKTIDDLYNKAEEIYANISIIKMLCEQYYDVDDFYKIKGLINRTETISDILYLDLINLKSHEK